MPKRHQRSILEGSKIMKVLQVNCVCNKGSTGKITYDLHSSLKEHNIESVICYGRGDVLNEENVYKTCGELYSKFNNLWSRVTGIMYGGCFFSTNKLISIIKKEKPDIVHLQCINGYFVNIYRIVSWLKKQKIKTVLTLHAEFMYTANCGNSFDCDRYKSGCGNCPQLKKETKSLFFDRTAHSWKKMKKAFEGFDENLVITSVSPWLMGRAKSSSIMSDKKHVVVMNGLDTSIFKLYDTKELREQHSIGKQKVIFHATPYFTDEENHIKGGNYIIKLAEKLKTKNIKVLVAGRYKEGIKVPENLILLGNISNQTELAKYYSMADLTVIASKRETFSMICAESLCCGTAVVGFKAGGPETISIPQFSSFVEYGDENQLYNSVLSFLDRDFDTLEISKTAKEKYDKQNMCIASMEVYRELMEK